MENLWKIYGLSSIIIVLLSSFIKPKRDTMRKIWMLYGLTPVLIIFINLFRQPKNNY